MKRILQSWLELPANVDGGTNIPVVEGSHDMTMKDTKPQVVDFNHGATKLGNRNFPPPKGKPNGQSTTVFLIGPARLYPRKATMVVLRLLTNITWALQPNLITEIPALSGPCQTIDGINQGGAVGYYLLGNWKALAMNEQEVKVLTRKYDASYKSLTNVWEDYLAMKLSSIEGQFKFNSFKLCRHKKGAHHLELYVCPFSTMDSCEELIPKYLGVARLLLITQPCRQGALKMNGLLQFLTTTGGGPNLLWVWWLRFGLCGHIGIYFIYFLKLNSGWAMAHLVLRKTWNCSYFTVQLI